MYGETFGNSTLTHFQNSRSTTMASSKSHYYTGDVSVTTLRSHLHAKSPTVPYCVRYNIDIKRQNEINDFNMVSLCEHSELTVTCSVDGALNG